MKSKIVAAAAFAALLAPSVVMADSDYPFTIYNNSTRYPIIGFQTYEGGRWVIWDVTSLPPGQSATFNWETNEGVCSIRFRIIYSNYEPTEQTMDFCQRHSIIVTDTDVTQR